MSAGTNFHEPRAIDLLDEAVAVLQSASWSAWFVYALGAFPFAFALLYFVSDMSEGFSATERLPLEAAWLSLSYVGLKVGQAYFSATLLQQLRGEEPEAWSMERWFRVAQVQAIFGASLLLVYPVMLCIGVPFAWMNAFYHNVSLVGTKPQSTVRSTFREAWALATVWVTQNHLLISFQLLGVIALFLNILILLIALPGLLNTFFGLETVFSLGAAAFLNMTFLGETALVCFLITSPFSKAVYALRCFYYQSRSSGVDIKAGLQRLQRQRQTPLLAAALLMLFVSIPVRAQSLDTNAPPAVSEAQANRIDKSITSTLEESKYAWRQPRPLETASTLEEPGWLTTIRSGLRSFFHFLGQLWDDFINWLFPEQESMHDHKSVSSSLALIKVFLWSGVLLTVLLAAILLYRRWRAPAVPVQVTAGLMQAAVRSIDLEKHDLTAAELPEDSWLALALEMSQKGELRLALRATYLATLARLAHQELIRLNRYKSNMDYLQETTRRSRQKLALVELLKQHMATFEASWYGSHPVEPATLAQMQQTHRQITEYATA